MDSLRSDGKAVEVVVNANVTKGDFVRKGVNTTEEFFGMAMQDAVSGETIAIEVAQREHEIAIPGGVSAAKGAVLYYDASTGAITATSSGNKAFLKVTVAKDANNYVWGILLPQA